MARLLSLLLAASLAVGGCGSLSTAPSSNAALVEPTTSPSAGDSRLVTTPSEVPSNAHSWWAWPADVTMCGTPALYRIGDGPRERLGNCAGMLFVTPASVEVRVGQEIDLHMITNAPAGASPPVPVFPLPSSPDDSVLRLISRDDNGATGRFLAIAAGDVTLLTNGFCLDIQSEQQSRGACPVLRVRVTP
jgi:hypothetical protein